MSDDPMTVFPEFLSDEAAFALSETLHWLAMACEEKYPGQIRRHMATLNAAEPVDPERPWLRKTSN
jgi:predicted secreted protein